MAKTKEQKRAEAQQRAEANTTRHSSYMMSWVRYHHSSLAEDCYDRHTLSMLRVSVAAFYNHLRDCGLPHEAGAFYIHRDKVIIAPVPTHKRGYRKCLYCLQRVGQYHKAPCANEKSGRVDDADALFLDWRADGTD